jgi:CRISPR-associated protein (TIGR02710 family)
MSSILLITVGGSHQPIVTAIQTLKPDRVIFICSEGSRGSKSQVIGTGKPCEVRKGSEVIERLPNIPIQVGLGEKFQPATDLVLLDNPDNLAECYQKIATKIQELQQISPLPILKADYTGGTKTMTASLVIAAIDHQVELLLTTGDRFDLIRVKRGEMTSSASVAPVLLQRSIERILPVFLQQYNYAAAIAELTELLAIVNVSPNLQKTIQILANICKGFEAWDRFDHEEAIAYLDNYRQYPEILSRVLFLRGVVGSRKAIDIDFKTDQVHKNHGYEIVQDLFLNAERRATQNRYDDAVGRLYRAIELLAQVRLLHKYEIVTGKLELSKLPEEIRGNYRDHAELPLQRSYELLTQLNADPIGKLYQQRKNKIQDVLRTRNHSLFAHGFRPVTRSDYEKMSQVIGDFIQNSIIAVVSEQSLNQPIQFPTTLDFVNVAYNRS